MHGHALDKLLFNIILHLRLDLPSGLLPSGFTTKTPHDYLFPHTIYDIFVNCSWVAT